VFVLNAVSFVGIAAVVARWRAPERIDVGSREHLVEACAPAADTCVMR
jgi:hypothetical protein